MNFEPDSGSLIITIIDETESIVRRLLIWWQEEALMKDILLPGYYIPAPGIEKSMLEIYTFGKKISSKAPGIASCYLERSQIVFRLNKYLSYYNVIHSHDIELNFRRIKNEYRVRYVKFTFNSPYTNKGKSFCEFIFN